jgi:hypothetical protein
MAWLAIALILSAAVSVPVLVLALTATARLQREAWRRVIEEARRPSAQGHSRAIGLGGLGAIAVGLALYGLSIGYLGVSLANGQFSGWAQPLASIAFGLTLTIAGSLLWHLSRKRRRQQK